MENIKEILEKISRFVNENQGEMLDVICSVVKIPNSLDCGPGEMRPIAEKAQMIEKEYGDKYHIAVDRLRHLKEDTGLPYSIIQEEVKHQVYKEFVDAAVDILIRDSDYLSR